ncbi:hypothetical protein LXL04_002718 [Taraxacum kok-saghyz]
MEMKSCCYRNQCENLLKNESGKFQTIYETFCKAKNSHLQALKGCFVKSSMVMQVMLSHEVMTPILDFGRLMHPSNSLLTSSSQSSIPDQDQAGPSDLQTTTNSWKSRFNAISLRYKESLSKSTKELKDRLFNKSPSMSNIGSEDNRREVENVSQMMDQLQVQTHDENNIQQDHDHPPSTTSSPNDNNAATSN